MMSSKSLSCLFASAFVVACTAEVSSDAEARQAYLALDPVVNQALDLGFLGFSSAASSHIDAQSASGAKGGTVTVTGKVDQGESNNKNMALLLHLVAWTADAAIRFDTSADEAQQPKLILSLKNLPNGDVTGTLVGDFAMKGALERTVALNLTLDGSTIADAGGKILRKPGSMHVTGTATSGGGTFLVDVTR